ncbi:MAG: ABC transporter permease [Clostridia bacterium]|nr:ABC transporter permease [Clostridia bacterium]
MIKLLRANLTRIFKSVTFWIIFSLYILYSVFLPVILHSVFDDQSLAETSTESILALGYGIVGFPVQGVLIAIMCCIIFGLDFQNGTLRNKIIFGHSRSRIYTADFLTISIISLAMNAVYLLAFLMISLPLFGKFTIPPKDIILLIVDGTFMLLAYSATYTFVALVCKNPIVSIIISIALFALGMILITVFADILNEAQYLVVVSDDLIVPDMPSKSLIGFSEFMLDFFPSGQSFQIANNNIFKWQMPLYSLIVIGVTNGAGITIFNKVNIK